MTDRINTTGSDSHIITRYQNQIDSRRNERDAALEAGGPSSIESITPEHASELTDFYNTTLQNIDLLRHPIDFPDISPPLDFPYLQAGDVEVDENLPSGVTGQGHAAAAGAGSDQGTQGSDSVFYGRPPERMFYHGSPEEMQLKQELESARQSGNKAEIKKARENLNKYWRNIIDQEYRHLEKSDIPAKMKTLKKSCKDNPRDPFVQYRLHSLTAKARECGDTASLKQLQQIKNGGVLKASSPTGNAIADYANNHTGGNGHQCYEYVANALDTQGVKLWGESAYMAANQLAQHPKVREIKGVNADQLESLPKGAIVVWNRGNGHDNGHISISLGNGKEVSDIVRDQLTDYGTSFRVFVPLDMIDG